MKIWNFKTPLALVASAVWNISEYLKISLGNSAPLIFHLAIGSKKYKRGK